MAQVMLAEVGDFRFAECRCEYSVDEVVGIHRCTAVGAGDHLLFVEEVWK
jgi:hypothetical protein